MARYRVYVKKTLRNIIIFVRKYWSAHKYKYLPYWSVPVNWYKNRNLPYRIIDQMTVRKEFKKSDTIFILGSGPSLNDISKQQWDVIKKHDTFGINFSFLKGIVTSYHFMEYVRDIPWREKLIELFNQKRYRDEYQGVVFFLFDKILRRFAHPRLIPSFFPKNPILCKYNLSTPINFKTKRAFQNDDFANGLLYRGSMSCALDLVVNHFGYRNIVLIGVDLDVPDYFYKNYSEMKGFYEKYVGAYFNEACKNKDKITYDSMVEKPGKLQPFDVYLYALADYLRHKRKVNLFTSRKQDYLFPRLPSFFH